MPPRPSRLSNHLAIYFLVLCTPYAFAQTNWDQINQQNDEISRRITEQQRQSQEAAQDGYMRQQQAQAEQDAQQQDAQQQYQQQSYQAPQAGWVNSYAAMALSDLHSDAWVAVNYRSKEQADAALAVLKTAPYAVDDRQRYVVEISLDRIRLQNPCCCRSCRFGSLQARRR